MHMQLPEQDAEPTESVSSSWSRVAAFASAIDASLDKWLMNTHQLGLTEYRALMLLSQQDDKELRVAALAQRLGLNASSTTRLVSRLETKGLARRDVCEDDGRGVYAVIDEAGEARLSEVREPYEARVKELLDDPSTHFPHLDTHQIAAALAAVGALITA